MIRPIKRQRKPQKRDISTLKLYQDERDRWLQILDQLESNGTQQDKMSALLQWIEQSLQNKTTGPTDPGALEQLARLFIEPLQPLKDPEAIRTLCRQEIADLEQDYYPEEYLPLYREAIAAAIRSGQLPLIDGQTAERTNYTKAGVNYEQRTHYALLFLEDLEYDVDTTQSSPSQQRRPKTVTASNQAEPDSQAPTSTSEQTLETLTTALTQLVQLMQEEQTPTSDLESARNNGYSQPQPTQAKSSKSSQPQSSSTSSASTKTGAKRRGRSPAAAEAKITRAIDAIMDYNNAPDRPFEEKWAISSSILKRLTKCYQGVIQRVMEARETELKQHHQVHQLGSRHNVRHGRAGVTIEQIIQLEPG